ncbi:MAG: hypothetical protein HYT03_03120 [Candidatus Harrisonbacteria bacterium]|nr:hypothetical protein [Candidatus Harrisonbacteria bacterium]
MMNWHRLEVFLEFLIFGVIVGVAEDLIAVTLATGEPITLKIIGIVVLVAIPFAFFGEVLVDRVDFVKIWQKLFSKKDQN